MLAPPEDRERLKAHLERDQGEEQRGVPSLLKAENRKLAAEARQKLGAYLLAASDVLRYEQIALKPVLSGRRKSAAAENMLREATSFERGNAPQKLEKGKPNVARGRRRVLLRRV